MTKGSKTKWRYARGIRPNRHLPDLSDILLGSNIDLESFSEWLAPGLVKYRMMRPLSAEASDRAGYLAWLKRLEGALSVVYRSLQPGGAPIGGWSGIRVNLPPNSLKCGKSEFLSDIAALGLAAQTAIQRCEAMPARKGGRPNQLPEDYLFVTVADKLRQLGVSHPGLDEKFDAVFGAASDGGEREPIPKHNKLAMLILERCGVKIATSKRSRSRARKAKKGSPDS